MSSGGFIAFVPQTHTHTHTPGQEEKKKVVKDHGLLLLKVRSRSRPRAVVVDSAEEKNNDCRGTKPHVGDDRVSLILGKKSLTGEGRDDKNNNNNNKIKTKTNINDTASKGKNGDVGKNHTPPSSEESTAQVQPRRNRYNPPRRVAVPIDTDTPVKVVNRGDAAEKPKRKFEATVESIPLPMPIQP